MKKLFGNMLEPVISLTEANVISIFGNESVEIGIQSLRKRVQLLTTPPLGNKQIGKKRKCMLKNCRIVKAQQEGRHSKIFDK